MQLKKEHPKLGKQSQIWALTLDKVYATFGVSAPEQTQNVCFRFLPDMKQVSNAMQVSVHLCLMMAADSHQQSLRSIRLSVCCTHWPCQAGPALSELAAATRPFPCLACSFCILKILLWAEAQSPQGTVNETLCRPVNAWPGLGASQFAKYFPSIWCAWHIEQVAM